MIFDTHKASALLDSDEAIEHSLIAAATAE
jgi:hypothetical protein